MVRSTSSSIPVVVFLYLVHAIATPLFYFTNNYGSRVLSNWEGGGGGRALNIKYKSHGFAGGGCGRDVMQKQKLA